jgi:hypothetical protein
MNDSQPALADAASERPIGPGTTIVSLLHPPRGIAEATVWYLAPYVGPRTASAVVADIAKRTFARDAESLERCDVPMLLGALRPLLFTLLGRGHGEVVRRRIAREVLF